MYDHDKSDVINLILKIKNLECKFSVLQGEEAKHDEEELWEGGKTTPFYSGTGFRKSPEG